MLFEGEYLDGERWNGKGKGYYSYMKGELEFDDKCFNEEIRSGKGWRFNKTINFEG